MRLTAGTLLLAGMGFGLGSCGGTGTECLALPCPAPVAVEVNVTAIGGGPIAGVTVRVSGATSGTASCSAGTTSSTCYLPGGAGTYNLEVAATGFDTAQRTVTVAGTTPECGCPTVETAHLDVALSPSP